VGSRKERYPSCSLAYIPMFGLREGSVQGAFMNGLPGGKREGNCRQRVTLNVVELNQWVSCTVEFPNLMKLYSKNDSLGKGDHRSVAPC
jgi:hypothetical protein